MAAATAAILPADWQRLRSALIAARDAGVARDEMAEVLLQSALFFGFPRAITAFEQLEAVWPGANGMDPQAIPPEQQDTAGRSLFAAIYGRNDCVVRDLLHRLHPELHDFVLQAAYGRILSRPGLATMERELLAVTALAALHQVPQLLAHARGALAFGADRTAVHEAVYTALRDDAASAQLLCRL